MMTGSECIVFLSPPWGGPEYRSNPVWRLSDMPIDGTALFTLCTQLTENICYYLPRNCIPDEVSGLGTSAVRVEQVWLNYGPKACLVYYGGLV